MKCDWVRQNILFYVYNELEDDARYEVEQHLARCPECATELKATRKFHATLSETVAEPTPNLLAASRMRLQEALETTSRADSGSGWSWNRRLGCGSFAWPRRWRRRFSLWDLAGELARLTTFFPQVATAPY